MSESHHLLFPTSYTQHDDFQQFGCITDHEQSTAQSTAVTLERLGRNDVAHARPRNTRFTSSRVMATIPGSSNYELIAHDEENHIDDDNAGPFKPTRELPLIWRLELFVRSHPKAVLMSLLILSVICYSLFTWPFWKSQRNDQCDSIEHGFQCQPEISHYWGQYSPYFSVPSTIPDKLPDTCEITFVQVLARHGARDPTRSKSIMYSSLIKSLHASVDRFTGKYSFLNDYQYTLGADQLTLLGRQHMVNSGIKFYNRYKDLAVSYLPFVRAAGQQRVIDSAALFVQGYHEACKNDTRNQDVRCKDWPYPYVEISEAPGSHNPLNHGLCTAFETSRRAGFGSKAALKYRDIFATPITARLNRDISGVGLENDETVMLMDLCPFETVAGPEGKLSPFCGLFTEDEWKQYDYYETLGKYYGWASYDTLGPTQGVGFTNELISRLTAKPVEDHTSVDHDLDDNPEQFPLGAKWNVFADFSHDNDMVAILSAMGIFNSTKPLSYTLMQPPETVDGFSTSWLVPFGARVYFEKMVCKRPGTDQDEDYIRIIINDRVQAMKSCQGDALGRCTLSNFLDSLTFAKQGGRWDEC